MKKKKKKSAARPKKAAKRAASGALKKVLKKARKGPAGKPKKQKKQAKPAPAKKGKKTGSAPCANPLYPDVCAQNFTASNGQCVNFQNLPSLQCTISQEGDVFPFAPYSTDPSGNKYATITASSWLTVSVPAINESYPYAVDCCGGLLNPAHSVTVDS